MPEDMSPPSFDVATITPESLPQILKDAGKRQALMAALAGEQGRRPALANCIAEVAAKCRATPAELDEIVSILLAEDPQDKVLGDLIHHPQMPEGTLFRILDAGRCIPDLGHRAGPESLLLRLAEEHQYPEAILTLALHHYGAADASEAEFLAFVQRDLDLAWLRQSLRVSDAARRMPEARREAALRLVEAYEAAREHDRGTRGGLGQ